MSELVKAKDLVLDYSLYPRNSLVQHNLAGIRETLQANGEYTLPPVIADTETRKVVDGFHRITSVLKEFGEDADIEVEFEDFDNDGDLFLRAVQLNVGHGQQISKYEKVLSWKRLEEDYGFTREFIASHMQITLRSMGDTIAKKVTIDGTVTKNTLQHVVDEKVPMTKGQKIANNKSGGWNQTYYINQVANLLENDAVNWDNANVRGALEKLHALLNEVMN